MYAVFVHQPNISNSNEVPSAKHMYYHMVGRAGAIPSPLCYILLTNPYPGGESMVQGFACNPDELLGLV